MKWSPIKLARQKRNLKAIESDEENAPETEGKEEDWGKEEEANEEAIDEGDLARKELAVGGKRERVPQEAGGLRAGQERPAREVTRKWGRARPPTNNWWSYWKPQLAQ